MLVLVLTLESYEQVTRCYLELLWCSWLFPEDGSDINPGYKPNKSASSSLFLYILNVYWWFVASFKVGLTCMAKLRDERFVFSSDSTSDTVTCLDIIMSKQLSNGACRSILFKLIMAILRHESSEALRRR